MLVTDLEEIREQSLPLLFDNLAYMPLRRVSVLAFAILVEAHVLGLAGDPCAEALLNFVKDAIYQTQVDTRDQFLYFPLYAMRMHFLTLLFDTLFPMGYKSRGSVRYTRYETVARPVCDVAAVLGLRPAGTVPAARAPARPDTDAYRSTRHAAARQAMLLGKEVQLLGSFIKECSDVRPLAGLAEAELANFAADLYHVPPGSCTSYSDVLGLYEYATPDRLPAVASERTAWTPGGRAMPDIPAVAPGLVARRAGYMSGDLETRALAPIDALLGECELSSGYI